jgi:hypothetical protein
MIHPHIVEPQEPIIITRTVTNTIEVIKETTKKIAE